MTNWRTEIRRAVGITTMVIIVIIYILAVRDVGELNDSLIATGVKNAIYTQRTFQVVCVIAAAAGAFLVTQE